MSNNTPQLSNTEDILNFQWKLLHTSFNMWLELETIATMDGDNLALNNIQVEECWAKMASKNQARDEAVGRIAEMLSAGSEIDWNEINRLLNTLKMNEEPDQALIDLIEANKHRFEIVFYDGRVGWDEGICADCTTAAESWLTIRSKHLRPV